MRPWFIGVLGDIGLQKRRMGYKAAQASQMISLGLVSNRGKISTRPSLSRPQYPFTETTAVTDLDKKVRDQYAWTDWLNHRSGLETFSYHHVWKALAMA